MGTDLVVDCLATYRLTRLVTGDWILDRPRNAVLARSKPVFDFVTCPWCVSVWIAAGVLVARRLAPRPWSYVATGLTASAVAGFLAERS